MMLKTMNRQTCTVPRLTYIKRAYETTLNLSERSARDWRSLLSSNAVTYSSLTHWQCIVDTYNMVLKCRRRQQLSS